MGMESINSISTLQAQTVNKPVPTPKVNSESSEGNTTNTTAVPKVDSMTAGVAKSQDSDSSKSGYEGQEQGTQTGQNGRDALKKAVENINKNLSDSEAIFGFHDSTNRVTIKIVDKNTKELIRELPPEKTLDMIAKVWELAGLLVDEKR